MTRRRRISPAPYCLIGLTILVVAGSAPGRTASWIQIPPAAVSAAPDSIKPGLRLTYYLMTGSLSGSVNGWVPDEEGEWVDRKATVTAQERQGNGSHGLIQATVVGGDGGVVALAEPFYLFNGDDTTSLYNTSLDSLVTADTGGDLWMHPRQQAQILRAIPGAARTLPGRTWPGPSAGGTTPGTPTRPPDRRSSAKPAGPPSIFDQASGYLLYLSRLTSEPPDIRDRNQTLRRLGLLRHLPPLPGRPAARHCPGWAGPSPTVCGRRGHWPIAVISSVQGQGIVPTPLAIHGQPPAPAKRRRLAAGFAAGPRPRGSDRVTEFNSVDGPGSLAPLAIPPGVLAGLAVGQVIDRDPLTGFAVRASATQTPNMSPCSRMGPPIFTYVYERARGLLLRKITQDRSLATGMVKVTDIQLAGIQ